MTQFTGILQRQVQRLEDALRHRQEARCRDIVLGAERKAKQAGNDSQTASTRPSARNGIAERTNC